MIRTLGLAVLVLVALILAMGSFQLDRPVREAVVEAQGKKWKKSDEARFHGLVRRYGDWPYLMGYGAVAVGIAMACKSRRWTRIIAAAMVASTLAGIVANTSRLTTGRTRPRAPAEIEQGFYGPWHQGRLLIGDSTYNSFPSGHTATAFGLAVPVLLGAPLAGVVVLAGAALVAWSSIALGAHHPSDVVVSIIIATAVGWVVRVWVGRGGLENASVWVKRAAGRKKASDRE
ncbi:MAG: hypothetical protein Fur0032_11810 [Terrimicrobiaceae bacterium]